MEYKFLYDEPIHEKSRIVLGDNMLVNWGSKLVFPIETWPHCTTKPSLAFWKHSNLFPKEYSGMCSQHLSFTCCPHSAKPFSTGGARFRTQGQG